MMPPELSAAEIEKVLSDWYYDLALDTGLDDERVRTRTLMFQIGERDSTILAKQETIDALRNNIDEAYGKACRRRIQLAFLEIARAEAARQAEEIADDAKHAAWERSERD